MSRFKTQRFKTDSETDTITVNDIQFTAEEWRNRNSSFTLPTTLGKRTATQTQCEDNSKITSLLTCPSKIYSFPAYCDACWKKKLEKYIHDDKKRTPKIVRIAISQFYNRNPDSAIMFSRTIDRNELANVLECPHYRVKIDSDKRHECCQHIRQLAETLDERPIPFEDGPWGGLDAIEIKENGRYVTFDMGKLMLMDRGPIHMVRFMYFMNRIENDSSFSFLTKKLREILVNTIDEHMERHKFSWCE
jgi:hypothetical protein